MRFNNLVAIIISLLLIGCSSTYMLSDFSSKNKFYEDFNKSAWNKSIEITLNNDSSITTDNGAIISNDFLLILMLIHKNKEIDKNEVSDIIYRGHNMLNTILFRNGDSLIAKNIYVLSDSSIIASNYESTFEYLPINNIKKISYKNHWLGVPLPLISGTGGGILIGILFGSFYDSNVDINDRNNTGPQIAAGVTVIGFLTGAIIGWINGYTYTYQFNP